MDMNDELKTLKVSKESPEKLVLQLGEDSRIIDVSPKNEACVDFICEIINESRHRRYDIFPASEEQFFRALGCLCGGKFHSMNHTTFGIDSLALVIEDIQFNGQLSIIFFLPLLLSRINIPVSYES